MYYRCVMLTIVAMFVALLSGHAQSKPQNYDRLKKLLEEKYIPKKAPTIGPANPGQNNSNSTTTKPTQPPTSDQKSDRGGTLLRVPEHKIIARDGALRAKLFSSAFWTEEHRAADKPYLTSTNFGMADTDVPGSSGARPNPEVRTSSDNLVIAQQPTQVPTAGIERFVVQFKPNTVQRQIDALLAKYQMHSNGGVPRFGILYLERNTQNQIPSAGLLVNLRKEPIVQSAIIDSVVSPRSVPQTSDTVTDGEGGDGEISTYNWTWTVNRTPVPGSIPSPAPEKRQILDGNWGLKLIRMPPVWSVIERYRINGIKRPKPRIAIVDGGFATHEDLEFTLWDPHSSDPIAQPVTPPLAGTCFTTHGSHVLGIVGAKFNNGVGIDGIVPDAQIDALVMKDALLKSDPLADHEASRDVLFTDLFEAVNHYLELLQSQGYFKSANPRIVINMSLGGNYIAKPTAENTDPEISESIKSDMEHQARMWASMAVFYQDTVLFVVATGNDSEDRLKPLDAMFSHPLAWIANNGPMKVQFDRPRNILVVEAIDRSEKRANFSNTGGHVAAPGVEILSTLSPGNNAYSVCKGTSQAAPHVTGVAALMFELDPSKKPAEIVDIIRASAIKPLNEPGKTATPRVDALEAVLRLSQYNDARNPNLVRLADLNGDGKVDIKDMMLFVQDLQALESNRRNGTPFSYDMNGDGKVDNNECHWPRSDLNGDGRLSLSFTRANLVLGWNRTDWEVLKLAWTDTSKNFNAAAKETGLDILLDTADSAPIPPTSPQACR